MYNMFEILTSLTNDVVSFEQLGPGGYYIVLRFWNSFSILEEEKKNLPTNLSLFYRVG